MGTYIRYGDSLEYAYNLRFEDDHLELLFILYYELALLDGIRRCQGPGLRRREAWSESYQGTT